MAMMGSSAWNGEDAQIHQGHEDDFQQFLNMGGMGSLPDSMNFDFHDFQTPNGGGHLQMQAPPREHIDTAMSGTETPVILSQADPTLQHQMPPMTSTQQYPSIPTTMIPPPTPNEAIVNNIDAQIQYLQQQKMEHQRAMEEQQVFFAVQQQNRIVPPTPQSLELQAGNQQYYPRATMAEQTPQHQALDYRFQRIKDQQEMSFTPLVSPAVTPSEAHFSLDAQFTVPGAYFSPLTSPALHAQSDPLAGFDQRHGTFSTSSPGEMDLEMPGPAMPGSTSGELVKKAGKKGAPKPRPKANIRQSPISKPQRRKTMTTPNLKAQAISEMVEQGEIEGPTPKAALAPQTAASSTTGGTDSENGSISPEALNHPSPAEMPPPPVPKARSARPSPYIAPQQYNPDTPSFKPHPRIPSPATPASLLMKASSPSNRTPSGRAGDTEMEEVIENLELPESATAANFSKPSLAPINTEVLRQPQAEPSSSRTPSLQPLPSPSFPKPPPTATSASQSPNLGPGSAGIRKTPQLLPRGSKKRASISSVHVSPALRPKISPNIKPLLPGGASAEETASHLLATKSNYQRILEGTTVGGVSYPSELSTNLTSKRTSHKIAEQGRRNRINSALQEIATLLPKPPPKDDDEGEGADKKDKSTPNSKASTVEMAIEYIKQLQQDLKDANQRAEEAEKKLQIQATDASATG
ncbi:hypothetical protein GQ53DRAFT_57955 [Thozetella sp. PMI_491]|nr:hypothetical protein GQ53DRAFT_57955 [Thozetella sp. PMI_491]